MSASVDRLSDAQLRQLVGLIGEADTVGLKLTVPDEDRNARVKALGLDPLDAYLREVFCFDTPDLDLERAGLVTRARRSQDRPDDSVVKLRPVEPGSCPTACANRSGSASRSTRCQAGSSAPARSKGELKAGAVKDTIAEATCDAEHAPEGVDLDALSVLGPVTVLKIKQALKDYERKLVAELWFYPDGSRILERSTKCDPGEAFDVAARRRVYLSERGVNLYGDQQTKTRRALEYFAAQR